MPKNVKSIIVNLTDAERGYVVHNLLAIRSIMERNSKLKYAIFDMMSRNGFEINGSNPDFKTIYDGIKSLKMFIQFNMDRKTQLLFPVHCDGLFHGFVDAIEYDDRLDILTISNINLNSEDNDVNRMIIMSALICRNYSINPDKTKIRFLQYASGNCESSFINRCDIEHAQNTVNKFNEIFIGDKFNEV